MSTTVWRSGEPDVVDPRQRRAESRRELADRRRRMRRRRSGVLLLVLLLVTTVVARQVEDPQTAVAFGVDRHHPAVVGARGAATGVEPPPVARGTAAPAAPVQSATPRVDQGSEAGTVAAPAASPTKPVPTAGDGAMVVVAIPASRGKTSGRAVRYAVEVEQGLPVSPADFAAVVQSVLDDERGWESVDSVHFVPVTPAEAAAGVSIDIRVTLASPSLTAKLCAPLDVSLEQVSCWNGGRSVLNLGRWMLGSPTYGGDLDGYRTYLVNHEVGHGLGHQHERCPSPGERAPVMVQQTKSLEGCTAWPYPVGA